MYKGELEITWDEAAEMFALLTSHIKQTNDDLIGEVEVWLKEERSKP